MKGAPAAAEMPWPAMTRMARFCTARASGLDDRTVIMSRYTQPESDLKVLLAQLRLSFPGQPPPRMVPKIEAVTRDVVKTL